MKATGLIPWLPGEPDDLGQAYDFRNRLNKEIKKLSTKLKKTSDKLHLKLEQRQSLEDEIISSEACWNKIRYAEASQKTEDVAEHKRLKKDFSDSNTGIESRFDPIERLSNEPSS